MRLPRLASASLAALAVAALAACSGGQQPDPSSSGPATGPQLRMLVDGTPEEVDALQEAVDAWSETSGSSVRIVLASDLEQQLAESFANASPPDVFALPTTSLERYDGYLEPYGRLATADALVPWLLDDVADGGELRCVPRSLDALTLAIDEQAWADAGLTDADVPTTHEQLEAVAGALATDDRAGLAIDPDASHLGVLMAQSGGTLVDETGAVADSGENLAALEAVQRMHAAGALAWPSDVGVDSAAQALVGGDAAMAVVDLGALLVAEAAAPGPSASPEPSGSPDPSGTGDEDASDAPSSSATGTPDPTASPAHDDDATDATETDAATLLEGVRLVALPAGAANGTSFATATCWALPADTRTGAEARDLVAFLLEDAQQLALADATGTVPVTTSAGAAYADAHPERAAVVQASTDATTLAEALGPQEATDALDETLGDLVADGDEADVPTLLADLQERLAQQLDEG